MSTYRSSPYPEPSGPIRRRPGGMGDDQFRRRLLLIALVGLLVAPVVWALRGDGDGVSSQDAGVAAAIVQIDPTASDTPGSTSTTVAMTSVVTEAETTTTTAAPRVCAQKYTVQVGDSWYFIAEQAGITAGLLAGSNGVTVREPLSPGDEICLPAGADVPPTRDTASERSVEATSTQCGPKYTVQAGDSWYLIANRAGVKAGPLAAINGKNLTSPLKVGQVICLPPGARRPTAPATTVARAVSSSSSSNDMRQIPYSPARTYSRSEVERIVRDVWPDELENDALYVVERESHFNPGSRSSCCIGLFQINWSAHKKWLNANGVTDPTQLLDPTTNARMALVAWQRSGSWRPWCTRSWCPNA